MAETELRLNGINGSGTLSVLTASGRVRSIPLTSRQLTALILQASHALLQMHDEAAKRETRP